MKKILFYINTLSGGGAERAISNTASYFAEHGWNVILLTSFRTENEYSYSDKICRMSIEDEQVIQSLLRRNLSRIKAIRRICKTEQVDVVVSFMREPNFRALLATVGLRTKTVVSVRVDPNFEYKGVIGRIVGKLLLPHADGAVFQTADAKAWFCKKLQRKATVIYNVVDSKFFAINYVGGNDIVAIGRISPQKNQKLLIQAFKKVHDKLPNERLLIYGRIEQDMGLNQQIKQLGLNDSVFFLGQRNNIPEILSKAKLFVLSSDYEGMPNALMEAMAVGVPSISTDCPCGGPRELFGEELSDMLVPVGDVDALADKMIELLLDDERRIEIGRKMMARAGAFRADEIGEEWIEYVSSVCGE